MLTQMTNEELLTIPKYDRIAVYLFRRLTKGYSAETFPKQIPFDQETVRRSMRKAVADDFIGREVANVQDIKYTYDARRNLPAEMEQAGPMNWLQNGKGKYVLRREICAEVGDA